MSIYRVDVTNAQGEVAHYEFAHADDETAEANAIAWAQQVEAEHCTTVIYPIDASGNRIMRATYATARDSFLAHVATTDPALAKNIRRMLNEVDRACRDESDDPFDECYA